MTAHSFRGSGRSRGLKATAIMATAALGMMAISSPALAIDSTTTVETVAQSAMAGDKVIFPGNDGQSHT
ncbi:hypothetical protein, partial [Arthrobacter sp.]|uniref:hypothetical protein n=1 Tax=Arthrobacter sp. TaxID=1667 RepID=UPI0026DF6FC4